MADNIVNMHGEVIPHVVELGEELQAAIKQRIAFISHAQHSLECMKLELESLIKRELPETAQSKNIAISPDIKTIEHS